MTEEDAYNELCAYTLMHGDPSFIHQHVVDAYMAQHADERTKPIGLTFALVGLFLHIERKFTGRQVQRAHMQLARKKQAWPSFALPADRGTMTAGDVIAVSAGPARDNAIHEWSAIVWNAFIGSRDAVADLLRKHEIIALLVFVFVARIVSAAPVFSPHPCVRVSENRERAGGRQIDLNVVVVPAGDALDLSCVRSMQPPPFK
jgi:uncharacterized protein DUF5946